MLIHICRTCGTSYPAASGPPEKCPICEDERQYVPVGGQTWTTSHELADSHVNGWRRLEPDLFEIKTSPDFGIGQRALLLRTETGNVLWDCLALIDDATMELLEAMGGLSAIAISHPHYYTRCQDWAAAFGCPVYLHGADKEWVMRPDSAIRFWEDDSFELHEGITLLRLGGHFDGGTVLHWAAAADGKGVILTSDILQVAADTRRVSFMWSYPNMIPLSARTVRRMADTLKLWRFDRAYGAFPGRQITCDGSAAVQHSADRYIDLLEENH